MSNLGENIISATSTKSDGNMSLRFSDKETVRDNLGRFLMDCGLDKPQSVMMECDHGEKIVFSQV